MGTHLTDILRALLGLLLGGTIGLGFGLIQDAAHRRLAKRQENGRLNSGWAVMPGSMTRVGYLLIALVAVQFVSPALFTDGIQWWVSAGVAGGYGVRLFWQLRRERATRGL
jgi:hypothetical protein